MCGLFGVVAYNQLDTEVIKGLVKALGKASEERGVDAGGVSYLDNKTNKLMFVKNSGAISKNGSLDQMFYTSTVMGHTRFGTGASALQNFNNHPFPSTLKKYVMSHNGIITNDFQLETEYALSKTKIETDSYIVVRLIDKLYQGVLDFKSIGAVSEKLEGTFNLTFQDPDGLWIVKNNNPLTIMDCHDLGCYIYASTDLILEEALEEYLGQDLAKFLMTRVGQKPFGDFIEIKSGEIIKITNDGKLTRGTFTPKVYFPTTYNSKWYPSTKQYSNYGSTRFPDDDYPLDRDDDFYRQYEQDMDREYARHLGEYQTELLPPNVTSLILGIYEARDIPPYDLGLVFNGIENEVLSLPLTNGTQMYAWSNFIGKMVPINDETLLYRLSKEYISKPLTIDDFYVGTDDILRNFSAVMISSAWFTELVEKLSYSVDYEEIEGMLLGHLFLAWAIRYRRNELLDYTCIDTPLDIEDTSTIRKTVSLECEKMFMMKNAQHIYEHLVCNLYCMYDVMYNSDFDNTDLTVFN